jgi:DUF1365 family protein
MPSTSSPTIPQSNAVLLAVLLFVILLLLILGVIFVILPVYTLSLAVITSLRAVEWQLPLKTKTKIQKDENDHNRGGDCSAALRSSSSNAWGGIITSFYQGTVYHIRHKPVIHTFRYPLHFAVVDLDEAPYLFGCHHVAPAPATTARMIHPTPNNLNTKLQHPPDRKGLLWPLNTLMRLQDSDHLKNGEGLPTATTTTSSCSPPHHNEIIRLSMRERIMNLLHERTCGKLDLVQPPQTKEEESGGRRRIVLVTHLMYYGYCFNPVSFFFVMKPTTTDNNKNNNEEEQVEEEELEAIVVEVSNTPWNEMYVYVLHPDSIDIIDYSSTTTTATKQKQHRYRWRKAFHVSPFMTMDYTYDWNFVITGKDCITVEAKMIRQCPTTNHDDTLSSSAAAATAAATISDMGVINDKDNDDKDDKSNNRLYFTAGFDIHRSTPISTTSSPSSFLNNYPIQLALIIIRYPMYCMVIQLWIHYEAIQLLLRKNVTFIPHPLGSTTFISNMIEISMIPIFAVVNALTNLKLSWTSSSSNSSTTMATMTTTTTTTKKKKE